MHLTRTRTAKQQPKTTANGAKLPSSTLRHVAPTSRDDGKDDSALKCRRCYIAYCA